MKKPSKEDLQEAAFALAGFEFVGPVAEMARRRIASAIAASRAASARDERAACEAIARRALSRNETVPSILLAMLARQAQWIADAIAARGAS